jgi:hypothetical protein
MTTDTPTPEGVQNTLRDYLRVATATGELRGTRVEFTADGETWSEVLLEGQGILAARATVHRAGWEIPTIVTALWDESLPAEEAWLALWHRKRHVLFGAFTLRAALVRTFADILADRREADDLPEGGTPPAVVEPVPSVLPVDWLAELEGATTLEAVADLYEKAGKARVEPAIFLAIQRRLREMRAAEVAEIAGAGMVPAEEARAAFAAMVTPETPIGDITEQEWLVRIETATSDVAIDEIRRTLRAQPGGVTEPLHAAMKRRTREIADAEPQTAAAHAMRDALAKANTKPTPLTVAARGSR